MQKMLMKVLAITATFTFLSSLFTINAAALDCSFAYSVKGSEICLYPSLSSDAKYYRWTIVKVNDESTAGQTDWIERGDIYTQIFVLDQAAQYQITLQVKDVAGELAQKNEIIYTTASSLSIQGTLGITEGTQKLGRENIINTVKSILGTLPLFGQLVLGAIAIIVLIFLFDAALNISGIRKNSIYKATYRRK